MGTIPSLVISAMQHLHGSAVDVPDLLNFWDVCLALHYYWATCERLPWLGCAPSWGFGRTLQRLYVVAER